MKFSPHKNSIAILFLVAFVKETRDISRWSFCHTNTRHNPTRHDWVFGVSLSTLQWRRNGHDGVSNHQPHDFYFSVYAGADQRKQQSSASLALVRRIHRWPVDSLHKVPVARKMFPFDDVIMNYALYDLSIYLRQYVFLNVYQMKILL